MLESQSDGIRGTLRARQISDAGRRENQMLLPLVFLILPVTIAFAMYPSVVSLTQLNY
jgi:tight adherence protein C